MIAKELVCCDTLYLESEKSKEIQEIESTMEGAMGGGRLTMLWAVCTTRLE